MTTTTSGAPPGSMRLKVFVLSEILDRAIRKAEQESEAGTVDGRKVFVADIVRSALWAAAADGAAGDAKASAIALRSSTDGERRRYPLQVPRARYEAARVRLRDRGLSVSQVIEAALIDYVRGDDDGE